MERKSRPPSAFVSRRSAALFPRIGDPCYRSPEDEGRATCSESLRMLAQKSGGNTDTIV